MAAQTAPRSVNAYGGIAGNLVLPPVITAIGAGLAAGAKLYSGMMVGYDSAGNLVDAATAACLTCVGISRATYDNSGANAVPPTSGAAGAINGDVLSGPYQTLGDGTVTSTTKYGTLLYVVDNQTVSTSDAGGTRLLAGWFVTVDAQSNPIVMFGVASPMLNSGSTTYNTRPYYARAVMTTTAVASYTGTGTNVLTAGSNAALVAQDGVTMVAGDVILLQGGTLGSLAITAADVGPWVITSLGSSGSKFVFTRPDWWTTAAVIPATQSIDVGPEGTLFCGTHWTSWATPGCVIGTTDPALYPDRVMSQVTVTNGAIALSASTCPPLRSATKSVVVPTIANGQVTGTSTGMAALAPLAITAGYTGTAAVTITAMGVNGAAVTPTATALANVLFVNR